MRLSRPLILSLYVSSSLMPMHAHAFERGALDKPPSIELNLGALDSLRASRIQATPRDRQEAPKERPGSARKSSRAPKQPVPPKRTPPAVQEAPSLPPPALKAAPPTAKPEPLKPPVPSLPPAPRVQPPLAKPEAAVPPPSPTQAKLPPAPLPAPAITPVPTPRMEKPIPAPAAEMPVVKAPAVVLPPSPQKKADLPPPTEKEFERMMAEPVKPAMPAPKPLAAPELLPAPLPVPPAPRPAPQAPQPKPLSAETPAPLPTSEVKRAPADKPLTPAATSTLPLPVAPQTKPAPGLTPALPKVEIKPEAAPKLPEPLSPAEKQPPALPVKKQESAVAPSPAPVVMPLPPKAEPKPVIAEEKKQPLRIPPDLTVPPVAPAPVIAPPVPAVQPAKPVEPKPVPVKPVEKALPLPEPVPVKPVEKSLPLPEPMPLSKPESAPSIAPAPLSEAPKPKMPESVVMPVQPASPTVLKDAPKAKLPEIVPLPEAFSPAKPELSELPKPSAMPAPAPEQEEGMFPNLRKAVKNVLSKGDDDIADAPVIPSKKPATVSTPALSASEPLLPPELPPASKEEPSTLPPTPKAATTPSLPPLPDFGASQKPPSSQTSAVPLPSMSAIIGDKKEVAAASAPLAFPESKEGAQSKTLPSLSALGSPASSGKTETSPKAALDAPLKDSAPKEEAPKEIKTASLTPAENATPKGPASASVMFDKESNSVPAASQAKLSAVVTQLKAKNGARAKIIVHPDNTNTDPSLSRRLALSRGMAVRAALIDGGADSSSISMGFGSAKVDKGTDVDIFIE